MPKRVIPDANTGQLWRLDESGAWTDYGPNGDDLSQVGTVAREAVSGKPFEWCQRIEAGEGLTSANNREGSGSVSIGGWVNIAGAGGSSGHFLYDSRSGSNGAQIYYAPGTTALNFRAGNGSAFLAMVRTVTLTQDQWYHIVGVHTSGELRLYVDGVLLGGVESVTAGAHVAGPSLSLGVQLTPAANWQLNGRLADWFVDSVARTPWDIKQIVAAVRDPAAGFKS